MTVEEHKSWKKARLKEISFGKYKKKKKKLYSTKQSIEDAKIRKYGMFYLGRKVAGSFGSKNGG